MHGFSLFPSNVPKIALPNPRKKAPSLHRISLITASESRLSANGESIVIKMEEEQPPVPRFPTHQAECRDALPSPDTIGRAVTTMSPIDGKTPTQSFSREALSSAADPHPSMDAVKYSPSIYRSPDLSHSSPEASFSLGATSAATLVQPASGPAVQKPIHDRQPVDPSPIVPIRSMFPTYDPSLPLPQQAYGPQRPLPARLSGLGGLRSICRGDYRTSSSTSFAVAAQRTAPASVLSFPSDVMSVNIGPRISTQRELEKLWESSHGTEPGSAIRSFDLEMARYVYHPCTPCIVMALNANRLETGLMKQRSSLDLILRCPFTPCRRTIRTKSPYTKRVLGIRHPVKMWCSVPWSPCLKGSRPPTGV